MREILLVFFERVHRKSARPAHDHGGAYLWSGTRAAHVGGVAADFDGSWW